MLRGLRVPPSVRLFVIVSLVAALLAGCGFGSGTLGGRDKCWPASDHRAASVWRGTLQIDETGGRLATPEGDVIPLLDGALRTHVSDSGAGELLHGDDVVARAGDDVTLFGGAGADGALVVCAVEEIHAAP